MFMGLCRSFENKLKSHTYNRKMAAGGSRQCSETKNVFTRLCGSFEKIIKISHPGQKRLSVGPRTLRCYFETKCVWKTLGVV